MACNNDQEFSKEFMMVGFNCVVQRVRVKWLCGYFLEVYVWRQTWNDGKGSEYVCDIL